MYIKTLYLQDFRNYRRQTVELNSGLNVFVGDNAQGKTNLLEAIYVLSLSKSFRAGRETELIRHTAPQAAIKARIQKMAHLDLEVVVSHSAPKKLLVNNKATNANSFVGQLNIVLFTPDSLQLVKGSPGERRRFLDIQICQIDPVYRSRLLKYQRVVRQRNRLLKEGAQRRALLSQLPAWDNQLVRLGSAIIFRRQEFLVALQEHSKAAHQKISSDREDLEVIYKPFFSEGRPPLFTLDKIENVFWQDLEVKKSEEIYRGHTLVGPQRDDVLFFINGSDLKVFGSQGQQRTAVLSYILAELELMYIETGQYPVILLDDVMSELDRTRRSFLLSILNKKAQTIITTTNQASLSDNMIREAALFEIQAGTVM